MREGEGCDSSVLELLVLSNLLQLESTVGPTMGPIDVLERPRDNVAVHVLSCACLC